MDTDIMTAHDAEVDTSNTQDTADSTIRTLEKPSEVASNNTLLPPSSPIYSTEQVILVKRRGQWVPPKASRLRNSLLSTMGLLELANAGDFAANVWNEIPVPVYAIVFMALGGTLALVVSILALKDTLLSWENVCFLRRERSELKAERSRRLIMGESTLDVDVLLDSNFRELGSEVANRFGLDICSGFGAFLISIGTFMAIGGANRQVWFASNILSGYLGNAPIALYGLISSIWSAFIFRRASQHRHLAARSSRLQGSHAKALVGRRTRNVHIFTSVSAVSSIIGGAASLVTATRWEGYIVLIPVILSSMFYNAWLRRHVAYDRPSIGRSMNLNENTVIQQLELAAVTWEEIRGQSSPLSKLVIDTASLSAVINYFVVNDLLEDLCVRLMQNKALVVALIDQESTEVALDMKRLLAIPKETHSIIFDAANDIVRKRGPLHFQYRQRYLAEVLGTMLRLSPKST
ncbi:hypothetical protein CkaCkLH20_11542 [Colletotrichum karsti]|uniref:Integral membrane protein n=1 Tax=Colletotrichum karsti TaxID=1095194 RepID=A0A9P6LFS1_9PEZI|nr:uncharacterized protein CkaCkLH20_11542 [Colletotrichum karsti]KAF9870870.1 hypothetical protein CkaCkLH20_11542 [Colletotrichum karsti]